MGVGEEVPKAAAEEEEAERAGTDWVDSAGVFFSSTADSSAVGNDGGVETRGVSAAGVCTTSGRAGGGGASVGSSGDGSGRGMSVADTWREEQEEDEGVKKEDTEGETQGRAATGGRTAFASSSVGAWVERGVEEEEGVETRSGTALLRSSFSSSCSFCFRLGGK